MRTIEWHDGTVITIDQTMLPHRTVYLKLKSCNEVAEAIKTMKMRGAPLLGVAAAYGIALTAYHSRAKNREELLKELEYAAETLKKTRPTAVNLFWAIERVLKKAFESKGDKTEIADAVIKEAEKIAEEDIEVNRRIGENGSKLIIDGDTVLTHCNAGSLAAVDYGTALSVLRTAWKQHKKFNVIVTETRPLLQGARLTTYELKNEGIPVTLITDSMVGYVMQKGLVQKVIVGADRIVQDAVINKIGTYSIAVLAYAHKIPFYVAAPKSTFDLAYTSKHVVIEERKPEEVTYFASQRIAPEGIEVMNPAFDVTPLRYVKAIICEAGVISARDLKRKSKP